MGWRVEWDGREKKVGFAEKKLRLWLAGLHRVYQGWLCPYLWAGICVWVCYLNERVVCEALFFWVGNLVGLGNCCKFVAQILITSMGYLHLYHHHHCCFLTESWVPVCGGM